MVIFLPLMNLVEVDTDLKLPIPPPPPPKDEDEKEVMPPTPMSPNELKPTVNEQNLLSIKISSWIQQVLILKTLAGMLTYLIRTRVRAQMLGSLRNQRVSRPFCSGWLPFGDCDCVRRNHQNGRQL